MTPATITKNYLGRCPVKGCPTCVRVDVPARLETVTLGYEYKRKKEVKRGAYHPYDLQLYCLEHRRPLGWWEIVGHYADVPCNAKCTDAKRPDCDCSCGGQNHGQSWLVTIKPKLKQSAPRREQMSLAI